MQIILEWKLVRRKTRIVKTSLILQSNKKINLPRVTSRLWIRQRNSKRWSSRFRLRRVCGSKSKNCFSRRWRLPRESFLSLQSL